MKNQFALTTLTINLGAVAENYNALKQAGLPAQCGAVVKSDAYGLGVEPIAKTLKKTGCDKFFVATLDEAIELRNIINDADIFVFFGLQNGEEEIFTEYNLIPVLNDFYQIEIWNNHAKKIGKKLPAIIHIDTGMNRLGVNFKDVEKLAQQMDLYSNLDVLYIMSHLACISELSHQQNAKQLQYFEKIKQLFPDIPLTFNNSGGTFNSPQSACDLVRPGISLYGSNSVINSNPPLKNVITLESQIIQIRKIDSKQSVGYGATYKAKSGDILATIPVGYADGYIRSLSNNSCAYIGEIAVPIVGRISMDSIILDVSKIPENQLTITTKVELIGDHITVDKLAQKAGTIGYEILTNLGCRYKRNYVDG